MGDATSLSCENAGDIHVNPPVENKQRWQPKTESILWRGLKVVVMFFYETPVAILGIAIAGVVCHLLFPPFAFPLYALAGATMLSKLVVKVLGALKCKALDRIECAAWNLRKKHPKLRLITFIFVLALGYAIPIAGIALGVVLGSYNGIIIEIEHCKRSLKLKKKAQKNPSLNEIQMIITQ